MPAKRRNVPSELIEEALNPTSAIPITPLQQRAAAFRYDYPEIVGELARRRAGGSQLDLANDEKELQEWTRQQIFRGLWPVAEAELRADGINLDFSYAARLGH
jgi:hypothetical protein